MISLLRWPSPLNNYPTHRGSVSRVLRRSEHAAALWRGAQIGAHSRSHVPSNPPSPSGLHLNVGRVVCFPP